MVKLARLSEPSTHLLPELGLLLRVKVSPDPFSMLKKNWLVKTTTFPSCVGRLELLESGDRLTSEREPQMPNMRHHVEYAELAEEELQKGEQQADGFVAHYYVQRASVYATLSLAAVTESVALGDLQR